MSEYKRNPRGARRARKSMGRKAIVVLSLMLVLAMAAVGGTFAWLTSTPDPVTNTFTTAGIEVTLKETFNAKVGENATEKNAWVAQLVPSKSYVKDPVVTVVRPETDVDIYLFVKVDEKNMTSSKGKSYLEYQLTLTGENGWTKGTGVDENGEGIPTNVWYRTVKATEMDKTDNKKGPSWNLLVDNTVTVNKLLTKEEIPDANNTALPELTFTAYGIQTEGFADAAAAWAEVTK